MFGICVAVKATTRLPRVVAEDGVEVVEVAAGGSHDEDPGGQEHAPFVRTREASYGAVSEGVNEPLIHGPIRGANAGDADRRDRARGRRGPAHGRAQGAAAARRHDLPGPGLQALRRRWRTATWSPCSGPRPSGSATRAASRTVSRSSSTRRGAKGCCRRSGAGLDEAEALGADAVLLHPVDHPLVEPRHRRRVVRGAREGRGDRGPDVGRPARPSGRLRRRALRRAARRPARRGARARARRATRPGGARRRGRRLSGRDRHPGRLRGAASGALPPTDRSSLTLRGGRGESSEQAPKRRHHRPRRPRQDDAGRRPAPAERCLPREPGAPRAHHGLERARARARDHDPGQEHRGPLPRHQDQHRRHPRPRRLRRRGRARAQDGRRRAAAGRRLRGAAAPDALRAAQGARGAAAAGGRDQQDRPLATRGRRRC